ncbi:DUF6612 family protein [Paenisporosarcina cavernae]|uniref:Lipoprotein n=1 Tax=Paenisporosarcina cavernae TaxID=2320858 RepID=A0A385YVW2_9BACL|nr:DUF6612 family protein [Paenisporosarcina cavernae]AYC30430.1 hypothetical protein D3873_11530 [Paenisporosarcina cavernae]
MKNKRWITGVLASVLLLSACNDSATPTDGVTKEQTSELTLEEVFAKTQEKSADIKNLQSEISSQQTMLVGEEEMEFVTKSDTTMNLQTSPLAVYQKGTTSSSTSSDTGEPQKYENESYLTEEGFYIYDGLSDMWSKLPKEMSDKLLKSSTSQADPSKQLQDLEEYKKDFTFEQTANHYVLTLDSKGDQFKSLIEKQMKSMSEMGAGEQEFLDNMDIESIHYVIEIDKKTFYVTKMDVQMAMNVESNGQSMKITQDMKSTYGKFNELDEIKVPDDVKKEANEL